MSDRAWKAWERTVARIFGGQRRGADTRGPEGGKIDVIHSVTGHLNPALCGAAEAGDLVSGQGARPAKATSAFAAAPPQGPGPEGSFQIVQGPEDQETDNPREGPCIARHCRESSMDGLWHVELLCGPYRTR